MKVLLDESNAHVLMVDDQPENLRILSGLLSSSFNTHPFTQGEGALRYIERGKPVDLILLDIVMPNLSGYELCEKLRAIPALQDVPIVFLTALDSAEDEERGLSLGAVDFITKPFSPPIVLARVRNHVRLSRAMRFARRQNTVLEDWVAERTAELRRRAEEVSAVQDVTILALSSLAETRDNETGAHIRRTQNYVRALASALKDHPRFAAELTDEAIELIYKSAPLHDIGKVGIPDQILLKPGKLTPEEFEIMKTHTTLGRDAIVVAETHLGSGHSFLRFAREIAHYHQEKWDGSGYPEGLAGEAIPVAARLMAVADVYDALISKRVYKPAFPHERAVEIMREGRGRHFDPDVLDAFLARQDEFVAIASRYRDEQPHEINATQATSFTGMAP